MAARGLRSNRDGITTRQIQQPTSGPLPDSASPTKNGTVTSVGLTVPSRQSVAGSPVTKAGTLAVTDNPQSANQVFAGPVSGGAAVPGFRALVAADMESAGSFSPVVSFATPGDLSVTYESYHGADWIKIGSLYQFNCRLGFVPTFTTASGELLVTGFPGTPTNNHQFIVGWFQGNSSIPAGAIQLFFTLRVGVGGVVRYFTTTTFANIAASDLTSGTTYNIQFSGIYGTE